MPYLLKVNIYQNVKLIVNVHCEKHYWNTK